MNFWNNLQKCYRGITKMHQKITARVSADVSCVRIKRDSFYQKCMLMYNRNKNRKCIIHKSADHLLYLALYWRSHSLISAVQWFVHSAGIKICKGPGLFTPIFHKSPLEKSKTRAKCLDGGYFSQDFCFKSLAISMWLYSDVHVINTILWMLFYEWS